MSEFDRLRALLDNVAVDKSDLAAPSAPAAATPRSRRWTRALWTAFIVVTVLYAVYLLAKTLLPS